MQAGGVSACSGHLYTSQGIVRLLRQSDAQLFAGWGGYPGVNDSVILNKLDQLTSQAAALLKVTIYGSNVIHMYIN